MWGWVGIHCNLDLKVLHPGGGRTGSHATMFAGSECRQQYIICSYLDQFLVFDIQSL